MSFYFFIYFVSNLIFACWFMRKRMLNNSFNDNNKYLTKRENKCYYDHFPNARKFNICKTCFHITSPFSTLSHWGKHPQPRRMRALVSSTFSLWEKGAIYSTRG